MCGLNEDKKECLFAELYILTEIYPNTQQDLFLLQDVIEDLIHKLYLLSVRAGKQLTAYDEAMHAFFQSEG